MAGPIPEPIVLDCGCVLDTVSDGKGGYDFRLFACSETCRVVQMTLETADEHDKPVEIIEEK